MRWQAKTHSRVVMPVKEEEVSPHLSALQELTCFTVLPSRTPNQIPFFIKIIVLLKAKGKVVP
jgi:hypothetical protein